MSNSIRFLILGIGNAQVDVLRHLKKNPGIEVHGLSNSKSGRGYEYVDFFSEVDISKREAVLEYARAQAIDYIYSVGSDVAMPTVMWVAEQQGLPHFVSSETAFFCNTKQLLRNALKDTYGAVTFEVLDESLSVYEVSYPAMVKPVDSQGQRGVTTVNSADELRSAYEHAVSFSRSKTVIIENKIEGPEISVNTYVKDGEVIFYLPSDRLAWEGFDGGVIHKHLLPTTLTKQATENVRRLVTETLERLGIKNGPAYFQIKVHGEDPYLIEVTPRLDGCHMWHLIKKSTGVDLLDLTLKHLMGLAFSIPQDIKVTPSVLEFVCQPPGTAYRTPKNVRSHQYFESYYVNGQKVSSMNGKMEKCGYFINVEQA